MAGKGSSKLSFDVRALFAGCASRFTPYIPFFIFALALFLRLLPGERMVDDAYITFRYARNIVNGLGFVYNPGERVMGTTTPLYTLLMAGLSFVLRTQNFPALARWVNALADAATCALLVSLGETLSGQRRVGIAAGLIYAVAAFSVTFAVGGMETSIYILLIVLTALLYLRQNPGWAVAATLALLTRPDALIFLGPLWLDYILRILLKLRNTKYGILNSQFSIHKTVAFFIFPLIVWLLFATFYFGTPIPHSIAAKSVTYQLQPEEAFVRLWQHYSTPFYEQATLFNLPYGNFWPLPGIVLYLSLYLISALAFLRRDSRATAILLYPWLYFATFAIANPLIFRWYLTPPLPFYFLGLLGGLSHIANSLSQRLTSYVLRFTFPALCALFIFFSLRAWVLAPDHGPARPAPDMAWFKLEQLYTQVGKELAPQLTAQTVIAAGDIGALGYFSGARILDTIGLVSPESVPYYPLPKDQLVINYAISANLIADRKPDYVVFLEVYGRKTLLADSRFTANYTLIKKIATDIYGSDGMLVYQRK
ncbi:MAG: hypothetical protein HYZ49_21050 [Chloroflexi bacterium]|nr:hypothetical protein [Chloroflexota bacterium]